MRFVLETDENGKTTHVLALRARILPSWEVEELDGSAMSLSLGQPGKRRFRLTARRLGTQGRSIPERLSAPAPITVAFAGEATTMTDVRGITQATRDAEVTLPAASEPGVHRSEVASAWPDGHKESFPIVWEVRPALDVSPSALVLRCSPQPLDQSVLVTSHKRPFRVVGVQSALLAEPAKLSSEAGLRHELKLKIKRPDPGTPRVCSIEIQTDHPGQKKLALSVLVLFDRKEPRQ